MEAVRRHAARGPGAPLVSRLLRDDQAEGAVAAALHHGHDDVRGGRPLARARGAHLPGRRAVGRRRRGDQPRARPRHRPHDDSAPPTARWPPGRVSPARRRSPSASLLGLRRRSRCSRSTVNPLAAVLALSGLLGYVFVYTLWLKRSTPQNIVIGGAAGAVPPLVAWAAVTGGLDRHAALPVRDRLLLDAAPLLGAVAADEGRVRARGRADAAGRARRARDAPPDPALHGAARTRSASCRSAPARSARPTWSPRCCSAPPSSTAPSRLMRRAERRTALRLYLFSLAYLARCSRAMVADVRL